MDAPEVTLLEARSLLASSGTTGFRTWEAALLLGTYLFSPVGKHIVQNKNIIELGAGTGFLSILCATHLGAKYVLATDGSREVVDDLESNILLNGLEGSEVINAAFLSWGYMLNDEILKGADEDYSYDLVIGADVVGTDLSDNSFAYTAKLNLDAFFLSKYCCFSLTIQAMFQFQSRNFPC